MTENLEDFLKKYAPEGRRHVVTLDVPATSDKDFSPFIIVKHGAYTAVINPMGLTDHLCIDVHPFVDGQGARAGVFGMEDGFRTSFPDDQANGTSHNWPATKLVAVLLGEQKDL